MKTFSTLIVTCWRELIMLTEHKKLILIVQKKTRKMFHLVKAEKKHKNWNSFDIRARTTMEMKKMKRRNYGGELWTGKIAIGWGKIKSNHNSKSTSIKYAILRFIISTWNCVSLIKQFEQFSAEKRWCGKFSFDWSIPLLSAENSLQPAFTLWLSARRWKPYKR